MLSGSSSSGMCRGPGWDQNGWPQFAGAPLSLVDCIAACDSRAGCTAIDRGMGTGECYLWGHTNVQAELSGAQACQCWKKKLLPPTLAPTVVSGTYFTYS